MNGKIGAFFLIESQNRVSFAFFKHYIGDKPVFFCKSSFTTGIVTTPTRDQSNILVGFLGLFIFH